MVFNSTDFIFAFLPIALLLYVVLSEWRPGLVTSALSFVPILLRLVEDRLLAHLVRLSLLVNPTLGQFVREFQAERANTEQLA